MKNFHIEGPCLSKQHYMADTSAKLAEILELIEGGKYFAINYPRQYGKTTMFYAIVRHIQAREDYLAIPISFEGIGDLDFEDEASFCRELVALMQEKLLFVDEHNYERMKRLFKGVDRLSSFSRATTQWSKEVDKKVVLLIDEVDSSSKHEVFLRFLGVLRNKYIQMNNGMDSTFHNVILVGVHDIKNLKMKIRSDSQKRLNSPWNIAAEFKVEMRFLTSEIEPMLEEYVRERNIQMDVRGIAQQLYDYTSGYPYLVSKICKVVHEDILPHKKEKTWTKEDLREAVNQTLKQENLNFDSVIKNLENNPDLHQIVETLLLDNKWISYNIHNPLIKLGVTYGIFRKESPLQIHNQIYEQVIYNYMVSKIETSPESNRYYHYGQFALPNQELDIQAVVLRFQAFMKEQYNEKDQKFIEREGRLIFLAYLKPIVNSKGHIFIEPQISDEKRLDVVITYYQHKYIIELKLWYGPKAHDKGLLQLADYLERQDEKKGWLVIFEHQRKKTWGKKAIRKKGKDIYAVWV